MYRLEPKRELGNIFSIKNGCPYFQAGIANISLVKDLQTQTVVSRNFKCSKFGQHIHHALGWVSDAGHVYFKYLQKAFFNKAIGIATKLTQLLA